MDHIHLANSIAAPSYDGGRIYSVVLRSAERDSGTQNQANFFVNISDALPQRWSEYHCRFTFGCTTTSTSVWQLFLKTNGRSFTIDGKTESMTAVAGLVKSGYAGFDANPGICVVRPGTSLTVELRAADGSLAADTQPWVCILTFTPVTSSLVPGQKYQDV